MEIIAITEWNSIVSPLYDVSCQISIWDNNKKLRVLDVRKLSLIEKAELCATSGVNVLLCGAISQQASVLLIEKKVRVISWICGSVDAIISDYFNGIEIRKLYSMPGCKKNKCLAKHQAKKHYRKNKRGME